MSNLFLKITYNFDDDETSLKESEEFSNLPKIHQLDALRDAIYDIQKLYDQKLKEFHSGKIEGDYFYLKNGN